MADDFSKWDMYLDDIPVLYHEEGDLRSITESLQLQPTRTDTGENSFEIRPDYGNFYAQGDFSRGEGQRDFHQQGRDARRFLHSEGIDVFHTHSHEHGQATHLMPLHEVIDAADVAAAGASLEMEVANNRMFMANGTVIDTYNTVPLGAVVQENPFAAEAVGAGQQVFAIFSRGDELYSCLGTNGLHVRNAAGVHSHFNDVIAHNGAYLKERRIVVGGTGTRMIYEITTTGAAPTPIETLAEGWRFTKPFELNGFIYCIAQNPNKPEGRIHFYGLNDAGTAVIKLGSTLMPEGQLPHVGIGYLGSVYLGCGKLNNNDGFEPVLYQGLVDTSGYLNLVKLYEGVGAGARDCGIKAMKPFGEKILFGLSLGVNSGFGSREGLGILHPAVDGLAFHLRSSARDGAANVSAVKGIVVFKGHICYSVAGRGIHHQDLTRQEDSTEFIASIGDFNNTGMKQWDLAEVVTYPLKAGASVEVYVSPDPPEDATWTLVGTINTAGATGGKFSINPVINSRQLTVRLLLKTNAGQTVMAEVKSFSVRSQPRPEAGAEFVLTRYIRLFPEDRKDEQAEPVYQRTTKKFKQLQDKVYNRVEVREPGLAYKARVESFSSFKPAENQQEVTQGNPDKEVYVVRLDMTASRQ